MPRFSANLTMLFTERPFLDRFEAAADAGFDAVEFLFPYDHAPDEIATRLQRHRLQLVLHNLPAGNWGAGERGIACLPDRVDAFRAGVQQAITYAKALGVPRLNCLAGIAPHGADREVLRATFVDNLRHAADALAAAGLELLMEPINTFDIPGFFLTRTAQARALIEDVGADNLRIQYDIYHMQRMEGEIANTLKATLPLIGHVQLADSPGRHEPGTGELNWPYLFRLLDDLGYRGHIGCEYKPATTTEAGLGWAAPWLAQRRTTEAA
jgi:hydroxypyruvate isomerase